MSKTIIGLDKMTADFRKLAAAARGDAALAAIEAGGYVIMSHAQDNIRNKLSQHPTGFLANSVGVKRVGKLVLVGVFGVVYAKIHEFGGIVTARRKPFLSFQVNGKWVFTKKVVIPARPYLRPSVDSHLSEIKEAISDALRGLLQRAI